MKKRIIIVNIGNTSIAYALAQAGRIRDIRRLPTINSTGRTVKDAIKRLQGKGRISGSVICSVVPRLDRLWLKELAVVTGTKPLRVSHRLKLGINIDYPDPSSIGADRLANACGAAARYGTPVIVADFGTALTVDVISSNNAFIGGIIAPGLPLMSEYLAERTALLPRVSLKRPGKGRKRLQPNDAIGKSTLAAIEKGTEFGQLGMFREILRRIQAEPNMNRVKVCATGGYAEQVLSGSGLRIRLDPDLTLFGISRIYTLNVTTQVFSVRGSVFGGA